MLVQGARKTLKMGSRNPTKMHKNPSLDPKVSFLVLPGAPGSPHVPQGAKVEALGLPNDRLWVPKVTVSVSKMSVMGIKSCTFQQRKKKNDMETNVQKPAGQHTFQQRLKMIRN